MLQVQGLTKQFRRVNVVDHVSFALRSGEVTGYLGPNGSGKSTTVKMLTGLLEPTDGQILFEGRNIRHDVVAFRKRVGYVPEEPNPYGYLTGLEHLQLAGGLRGLEPEEVDRRANELLDLLYLRDASWLPISAYSKGMKQRILRFDLARLTWASDPQGALRYLDHAVRADATSASIRYARGWLLYRAGQAREALPDLLAAMESVPKNVQVLAQLGLTYLTLDKPAEAEVVLRRALAMAPDDPEDCCGSAARSGFADLR
jgi:ABC-type lipoprotein export system ATPase subunit